MDPAGLRPLGVGEVLDTAIQIYRARFGVLMKAVSLVLAPVFVLAALIRLSLPSDDDLFEATQPGAPPEELVLETLWAFLAGMALVTLVSFVASQIATAACFKAVSGAYLDEEPDWRASLRFARSRLGSLVLLSLLLVVLLGPAFLACVLPGVYLWGAWSVATPALLLEDRRGWSALQRSGQLVKDRWWPTFAVLVLVIILTAIVQFVVVGLLAGLVSVSDNDVARALADALGQTLGTALTTPLSAAVTTVLYFDLRVRKEGFDVELLARRLGVDPSTATSPTPPGTAVVPPPAPPSVAPAAGGGDDQPPFWPPPPGWRPRDG